MEPTKYLTNEQVDRLTQNFNLWYLEKPMRRAKYLAVFLLIRHTGARISEVLKIRKSDFDVVNRTVTVVTLKQKKGKQSFRTIRLPATIFSRVLELRALGNVSNKYKAKVNYRVFHRIFKSLTKTTGPDVAWASPHAMRHSCAIRLLKNGVSIEVVQRRLGHSSINSTMVYTHLTSTDVEDIIENAGAL